MTIRIRALVLAALAATTGNAVAQVNALPPDRHILVYGEAQAQAVPDRFRITVALEATDVDVDVARRAVEADLRKVLGLLAEAGVPAQEVSATSLAIRPANRYDSESRREVYEGMAVSREITARFLSTASLRDFLAELETSEAVQVSGVETELSTEPALMKALRQKAIDDTRAKARVIAEAYGVELGALYSVSDVPPRFDYGIQEGDWPVSYRWDGASTSLDRIQVTGSRISESHLESFQAGTITVGDKIYAVFLLAD